LDCPEATNVALYLGESIGFWIQTGAIALSAFGAIAILYNNSHQAKKRATIDLVLHENSNEEIQESKRKIRKCHDDNTDFTQMSGKDHKDNPMREHIKVVLNNYEFISAGIKEGAFDEEIYKRTKRSIIIRDWKALAAYITALRQQQDNDKLYSEFQWLAERWQQSKIKPDVHWWRKLISWLGL